MSKNDKNKLVPDYLDVSSDEDNKKKGIVEEEQHLKKESKSRHYKNDEKSYDYDHDDSYKNKCEDKYYHYRKQSSSSNRSRTHSRNKYRSSRSKSKNLYRHNRSRSRNYYSRSRSKNFYRYSRSRSRSRRYRNKDYSRSRSRRSSRNRSQSRNYYRNSKSKSYIDKTKDEYDKYDKNKTNYICNKGETLKDKYDIKKEEKNEYSNKKIDKWSDGIKKEDFKSIKIEKYDKSKKANQNSSKEISQLKKDLKKNKKEYEDEEEDIIEKEKPNFEPSGILQKDLQDEYNASMNNKVAINYKPPSDSVIPEEVWFLFKFLKDKNEADETYKLVGKEFFLIGKDNRICDIHIKQKNISRQHAVIQFRKITKNNKDGNSVSIIPYLIDLNSTNGTYLNSDKIDNSKYYELMDKDNLNFGDKKIDFVLIKMK